MAAAAPVPLHLCLRTLSSPQEVRGQSAAPLGIRFPEPPERIDTSFMGLISWYSPPRDFELIDGAFAVVVVDKVLVTHPDALVIHCEALG